jgi:regulator of protease activity HflC (stomatin/prohibitin superfamily)
MIQVNTTEQMVDAQPQEIITNDNLNARVDAQVYFKVKDDEASVKSSQYSVNNYQRQIVSLARTTLRNIIGTLTLKSANSESDNINGALLRTLSKETMSWGMSIVRTELKEIDPPQDVQETMNKVVKAENEKVAALDFANAVERQADGEKRAEIKKGRRHQAGQDSRGRRRGPGDQTCERGGEHLLRRKRSASEEAGGPRKVAEPQRQNRHSGRL